MKKKKSKFARASGASGAITARPLVPPPLSASTAQAALATLAAAFDGWVEDADGNGPGSAGGDLTDIAVDLADEDSGRLSADFSDQLAGQVPGASLFADVGGDPADSPRSETAVEVADPVTDTVAGDLSDAQGAAQPLILFATGTPLGGWQGVADGLLTCAPRDIDLRRLGFSVWHAALPEVADGVPARPTVAARTTLLGLTPPDVGVWGGVDPQALWTLETLAETFPQARMLVFVASPAAALANWLDSPAADSGTPALGLAQWCAGAERLLRHVQRQPGRCLLVNAHEAAAAPGALAALCTEAFGLPFGNGDSSASALVSPGHTLAAALAAALAGTDRRAAALYAELNAACEPLTGDEDEAGGSEALDAFDAPLAVQHFRALAADAAQAAQLRPELAHALQLAAEAEGCARRAGEQLTDLRRSAEDQLATLRIRLDAADRLLPQRLRQLHELQSEFDAVVLKARAAEIRLTDLCEQFEQSAVARQALFDALAADTQTLAAERDRLAELANELLAQRDAQMTDKVRLATALEAAEALSSERKAQLIALGNDMSRVTGEHDGAKRELAEKTTQADALAKDAQRMAAERELAQRQLAALQAETEALVGEMQQLVTERDTLSQELAGWRAQAEVWAQSGSQLLAERDQALDLAAQRQHQIETSTRRFGEMQDGMERDYLVLIGERDSLVLRAAERQAELDALAKARARVAGERDAAAAELVTQTARLDQALDLAAQRQRQIEAGQASERNLREQIEISTQRFGEMQEAMERDYLDLIGERDSIVLRAAERQAELDALAKARARVAGERDAAAAELAMQGARVEALAQAQARLTAERDSALRLSVERLAVIEALGKDQARAAGEHATLLALTTAQAAERQALADALTRERTQALVERDLALKQAAERGQQIDAARTRHDSLRDENEMLLLHLHEVQEEMERYYLDGYRPAGATEDSTSDLASGFDPVSDSGAGLAQAAHEAAADPGLSVGDVIVGTPRETPPHLELELHFHQLHFGPGDDLRELRMRLVEHHGKPGLTLFAARSGPQPLTRWRSNGQEDGQPYMLLVPEDDNAVPLLKALTPGDLGRLTTLAALLARQLPMEAPELGPHWPAVAANLSRQLSALPPAFRYRELDVTAASGAGLVLCFKHAMFGQRALAQLRLRWPGDRPGTVDLLWSAGDGAEPPLAGWPIDARGQRPPALALAFTSPPGKNPAARTWAAFSASDRALVGAVLECLPALFAQVSVLPAGTDGSALVDEAENLLKTLHARAADESTPRVRRLVRSLLGRSRKTA